MIAEAVARYSSKGDQSDGAAAARYSAYQHGMVTPMTKSSCAPSRQRAFGAHCAAPLRPKQLTHRSVWEK
jgi:hypothetical protein